MPRNKRKEGGGVGYVLRQFPVLSETFILNEILAIEAKGVPVHIFSLAPPKDPRFHGNLVKLKAPISYIPGILELKNLWSYNRKAAKLFGKSYYRTLFYSLRSCRPGFVWRFLQAAHVAVKAERFGIDHFHAHFATRPTTVAHLAHKITGRPYSITTHAYDIYKRQVKRGSLEHNLGKAKFVVAISDYNQTYLETRCNGSSPNIVRINNGIDMSQFAPNGAAPAEPFTILSVARFVEKKGLPDLVEACRHLRDREVDFQCWLIGRGRMHGQLNDLIKKWKLKRHVHILGPHNQDEMVERYRAAQLFVLPCTLGPDGNRDGLPVSIVEALACDLPVISTAVTGIPEVVHDGVNGLIVPEGDPVALADAIQSVIEDEALYKSLQAEARASVTTTFDLTKTTETLQRLFNGGPV
jgi:glycosyltransferase involved in cell wall biosynthesis